MIWLYGSVDRPVKTKNVTYKLLKMKFEFCVYTTSSSLLLHLSFTHPVLKLWTVLILNCFENFFLSVITLRSSLYLCQNSCYTAPYSIFAKWKFILCFHYLKQWLTVVFSDIKLLLDQVMSLMFSEGIAKSVCHSVDYRDKKCQKCNNVVVKFYDFY